MGAYNTDQRLVYFYLVAGTCPSNSAHEGTKQSLRGLFPATGPTNSNQFEFVGPVAGTKFWSLRLHFFTKMGSAHEGNWSPGLVAGTSRRD